jgi:GNAT superfamily N-acetyltransferase
VELCADHLIQALELSSALQWPYRLEDWAFAHRLGRGFAVETDGRLVGTALWWPYGDRYATAGMIIVAAEAQRRGIGRALMDALLADSGGRSILLNSTEEGLALYTRLGFKRRGSVHQHQAVLAQGPRSEGMEFTRAFQAADRNAIYALDRAASGMERQALIDALLEIAETRVIMRDGQISGYGCIRKWGRGLVIGPVVAATGGDARALIATLAAFHLGRFIRINLPAHTGLSRWLESIGLPLVYSEVAMTLGEAPETGHDSTLFVQSNPSLG